MDNDAKGRDISNDQVGLPWLGRAFVWVDRPGNPLRIVWALAAVCAILVLIDFLFVKHKSDGMEALPGFFAVAGFFMFSAIIVAARMLRTVIGRPEDFYGEKAIDSEDYPADQLERVDHGD